MKRFLLFAGICCGAIALALAPGCATMSGHQVSHQQTTVTTLIALGDVLKKAPPVAVALFDAGKIDKAQFNQIADYYTKAHAAYIVAIYAEEAYIKAGAAPEKAAAYTVAYDQAVKSIGDVQKLIKTFQGGN